MMVCDANLYTYPFNSSWIWGEVLGIYLLLLPLRLPLQRVIKISCNFHFVVVQSLRHVRPFVTPWTEACQASLSFTLSWSLLWLMSIESVMPSNHLILCHRLLFLPSVYPRIRVFSSKSALPIRGPKYWSFSFSNSPSNEYSGWISFLID